MNLDEIIDLLRRACQNPSLLPEAIAELQALAWSDQQVPTSVAEILRELAYDLDFFEPSSSVRVEDPSLIDEDDAIEELSRTLVRIEAAVNQ